MSLKDITFFKSNKNISYDPLTQVLTRKTFMEYMESLVNSKTPFTFFFFDFDDFKSINDVLGHNAGDEALIICAKRFISVLEKHGGVVGRYGGDEFIAIIENLEVYEDVWNIAREVNEVIREENSIENIGLALPAGKFTITSGIARYPLDGNTVDEILDVSDKALYRGKQKGKNCFIIYNHALHKNIFRDRETRNLDTKDLIDYTFLTLNDKSNSLEDNLKQACSFISKYFDVNIFSKNSKKKFEILYTNDKITDAKYVDEKEYLDLKSSEIDSMIFMYINKLGPRHKKLKEEFESQGIHASLLIPCQTKTKLYGYFRVDSKYERIWAKEEKIVFQVISNLYAVLLEFTNGKF